MEVTMNRNPLLCVVAILATCGLSAQTLAGGPAAGVSVDPAAYARAAADSTGSSLKNLNSMNPKPKDIAGSTDLAIEQEKAALLQTRQMQFQQALERANR